MAKQNFSDEAGDVVQIDEHRLDRECVSLPSTYLRYAHLAAQRKRDVDEAKAALDVVESDLSQKMRRTPATFGLENPTEKAIASAIVVHTKYIEATAVLNKAKYRHELAQAVVWALEHKKRSLTLLVELHGMGYFSDVKVTKAGKEAVHAMTKRRTLARALQDD